MPPLEMCGEKTATEHWQYLTQGQTGRVSFTSADKAIGAQVSWNGVFPLSHFVTCASIRRVSVLSGLKCKMPGLDHHRCHCCANRLIIFSVRRTITVYRSA